MCDTQQRIDLRINMKSIPESTNATGEQTPTPYNAPELVDYGPIEELTQAVSGSNTDGLSGSIID